MKTLIAISLILFACRSTGAEARLAENVTVTLGNINGPDLPEDDAAVSGFAMRAEHANFKLPDDVSLKVEWAVPGEYCKKVNSLGRFALHSWKTEMEAVSLRTFPPGDHWVSSTNAERIGGRYTLVVYRFAKKIDGEKVQFETIVDVFGETILGSMTFQWAGTERDGDEKHVAAIIDSIRMAK